MIVGLLYTPGTFETFDGIKTYIATPTGDYPKDKAIFFISDVFGHGLNNNFVRTLFEAGLKLNRILLVVAVADVSTMWRLTCS